MLKNRFVYAALAAVSVALFSACGGGGSGNGGGGTPPPAAVADYKITFLGPGGHSNGAYGAVNALHAAGRASVKLEELCALEGIQFDVKEIAGGNSVNSIASDGYLTVGLVSGDKAVFKAAIDEAADFAMNVENAFRKRVEGQTNQNEQRIDIRVDSIEKL